MASASKTTEAVELLVLSGENLRTYSFDAEVTGELLNLAALAVLRDNLGPNRPIFVGFIGCTGTGKSTLFNSLIGREISATGWRAHNTCGPVVSIQQSAYSQTENLEHRFGPLLFPFLQRRVEPGDTATTVVGTPDHATIMVDGLPESRIALVDLPDINTTLAGEDRYLAFRLQPWLDTAVFVVDDETLYHRDYEKAVALATEFAQNCLCVLNNRGRDRIDFDHPDLKDTQDFFNAASFHVLPELRGKERFSDEPEFLDFKDRLENNSQPASDGPLMKKIGGLSEILLDENRHRREALDSLENGVLSAIHDLVTRHPSVPLDRILHDEVLAVLDHLGLKRFTVSNVYQFFRRTATTRSLKRSFRLAFGDRRADALSQVVRLDAGKLTDLVHQRLSEYSNVLTNTIRRNQHANELFRIAPRLRSIRIDETKDVLNERIGEIVAEFESECRDLIQSDTISSSVKNDPFVALGVLVAIGIDFFTIPYFGSWLIVPSAMKYLPVGKFSAAKQHFQDNVQKLIRDRLVYAERAVREIREETVLEENDPFMTVLNNCAEYNNHES